MALNDIQIVNPSNARVIKCRTEANATAILAGEPVKIGGTGTNYVVPAADAEPTSTTLGFGLATSNSTQTASTDGTVDVCLFDPCVTFRAKAKSAAAIDTEAELLGIINDLVLFDLTSGSYTVDTASANGAYGLRILGGDVIQGTVDFNVVMQASQLLKTS